jgi:catalase
LSTTQFRDAEEFVAKIRAVLGNFAGYRVLHADGRMFHGSFKANDKARQYSRALHLQGDEVPVTVRISKGGGDPFAHFGNTLGLATRFYLPNGRYTNLVMLSQKLFVVNSLEQLHAILDAAAPLTPGGPMNKEGLMAFLPRNPNTAAVLKMRSVTPAPAGFAFSQFHAVHAFRWIDANNRETVVRCHWEPVAGVKSRDLAGLAAADTEVLFDEFAAGLKTAVAEWDLVLEFAEPGDPTNDATALWPEGRRRETVGRIRITAPITEAEIGDLVMNHDPTVLTDGIEATDDPILQIRRGIYEVSAAGRTGGWHGCPFAHIAGEAK